MPNIPKGEVRWTEHGAVARITIEGKQRDTFPMPTCKTKAAAEERCAFVAALAQRLRKAGVIKTREGYELLRTAAACAAQLLVGVEQVAGELSGGDFKPGLRVPTFAEFSKRWTSGELAKQYPDHVRVKDAEQDKKRLAKICAMPFGVTLIGDVPIDRFGLGDLDSDD